MDSTAMSPSFQRFQPVSSNKSHQLCTPQRLLSVKVSFRPPFPTRPCEDGLCRSLPKAIREKLQPIRSLRTEVRTGRLGDLESWEVEKLDEDGWSTNTVEIVGVWGFPILWNHQRCGQAWDVPSRRGLGIRSKGHNLRVPKDPKNPKGSLLRDEPRVDLRLSLSLSYYWYIYI